jgi:hypothetical protein
LSTARAIVAPWVVRCPMVTWVRIRMRLHQMVDVTVYRYDDLCRVTQRRATLLTTTRPGDPFAFTFQAVACDDSDEPCAWSVNVDSAGAIPIPSNYDEAMASEFAARWREAMDREIKELMAKNTWVCSDLPAARKATKSRWVYTVKYKHDGTVDRFKARFVCCNTALHPHHTHSRSHTSLTHTHGEPAAQPAGGRASGGRRGATERDAQGACADTRTHTHPHTHTPTHPPTRTPAPAHPHTSLHPRLHPHAPTHLHAPTPTPTPTHTHTLTHPHPHPPTHTHTHTHTRAGGRRGGMGA